eukprot:g2940.t1
MSNHITIVAQRNGETMQLNVEPTDTVLSVKQEIRGRWGFDVQRQKLNIDGLTTPWLDDKATLAEYNIANVDAGKRSTINTITLHVADDGSACASAGAGASFSAGAGVGANFGANDSIDGNSGVGAGEMVGNGEVPEALQQHEIRDQPHWPQSTVLDAGLARQIANQAHDSAPLATGEHEPQGGCDAVQHKAPIETAKARPLGNIALRSPRGNGHHGRDKKKRRMDSGSRDSGGGSSSESENNSGWRGAAHATLPLLSRLVPRVVVEHTQRPDLLVFKHRSDLSTNSLAGNIVALFYKEKDGKSKFLEFDLQRPKTSAGSNPVVQCDICLDTDTGYRTFLPPPNAATDEPPFKLVAKDNFEAFKKVQDDEGRWSYRIELKQEITTVKARIEHVSSKNGGVPYRLRFAHMDRYDTPEVTMPIFVGSKKSPSPRAVLPPSFSRTSIGICTGTCSGIDIGSDIGTGTDTGTGIGTGISNGIVIEIGVRSHKISD